MRPYGIATEVNTHVRLGQVSEVNSTSVDLLGTIFREVPYFFGLAAILTD